MKNNNIEISSTGIKFSYRRFLADTSIGFAVIFLFLEKYPSYMNNNFMLIFFILASTPIGLLVNISSWIILGFFQAFLSKQLIISMYNNKISFIGKYLIFSTNEHFRIESLIKFFDINEKTYTKIFNSIEHFLSIYYPNKINYYQDLIGMRIFYRNTSLVLLMSSIIANTDLASKLILFSIGLFFLIANVIVNIYGKFYLLTVFKYLFIKECYNQVDYKIIKQIINKEIKEIHSTKNKDT